jgi:hypothetical protein
MPTKPPIFTGILRRCPNLLIFSLIGRRYRRNLHFSLFSVPYTFPTTLKQLDANVHTLTVSSISTLLTHLPHLEILLLSDIREDSPIINYTKTILPHLRILQLIFSNRDEGFIVQFIQSLELPVLSAMCIGAPNDLIPALPKNVSKRLEYLELCFDLNMINTCGAEDFRNLRLLRLHGEHLSSADFRSRLPMKQIVELTWIFPAYLTPGALSTKGVVGRVMDFLLDLAMMPKLHSLILDIGKVTCDRVEKPELEQKWLIAYFEALAASFYQRDVDLWFDQPHL